MKKIVTRNWRKNAQTHKQHTKATAANHPTNRKKTKKFPVFVLKNTRKKTMGKCLMIVNLNLIDFKTNLIFEMFRFSRVD